MPVRKKFHVLTLGCPKNEVDSDSMAALLSAAGWKEARNPARADLVIVNTCGFIEPARAESLAALRGLAAAKRPGRRLIAAGCLSQLAGEGLLRDVPGLDGVIGTRRWMDLPLLLDRLDARKDGRPVLHLPAAPTVGADERGVLRAAVRGASAYLKIADGCNRACAFCAIPRIKGPPVSRPRQRILEEARILQDAGIRELILLAQDTTGYGRDLGERDGLPGLLEDIASAAPRIDWIRILYAFPGAVTPRLIEVMASIPRIVPYLDIPLQHAHPGILRRMHRPSDVDWVRRTVGEMRRRLPDLAVRTAFIVGFPGETPGQFDVLLDFMREMQFDHVGCFPFFREDGTPAASLADDVPPAEKENRRSWLMALQQEISESKNKAWIGRSLDVLIEGRKPGLAVGRSFRDAPEVDGLVFVEGGFPPGAMARIRVTGALPYDLFGVAEDEKAAGARRRPQRKRVRPD
ncbi:MAG: 30S ribosomal protein S12 methylthiotransferase RimO [Anaerolineales bacterium]|nr:30S ribosomal protein S12 methylthiotransferase RimO [Anaerolineales bacterium]